MTERNRNFAAALGIVVVLIALAAADRPEAVVSWSLSRPASTRGCRPILVRPDDKMPSAKRQFPNAS
jgi:hypothetical protein